MTYFVYILYSESIDRYYKGHTNNIEQRLSRHNAGYESYTSKGIPWRLILALPKETKSEAVRLEMKLKNLNGARLEAFILKYSSSSQDD